MTLVKRLILAFTVAAGVSPLMDTIALAAAPTLHVNCDIPSRGDLVTCRLSGRGFHAQERVSVTYRVTFTTLPRRHGHLPFKVYQRRAVVDRRGRFTRPPLGFGVVRYHESFRLTVTVVGATGDRASTTFVAIAQ